MSRQILIAGAGAAGMMAAVTAARNGAKVTLLDAMDRPGRKLLMTGNGRCNLTNLDPQLPERYYGSGTELAKTVISDRNVSWTLDFFHELGLMTREKNGYVYPFSNQASAVLDILLGEIRRLKIKLKLKQKILSVQKTGEQWTVTTDSWSYTGDSLILACGSKAVPSTGSDGSGYDLARSLGHSICHVAPALVPVCCQEKFYPSVAGVRCQAEVTLYRCRKEELIFTAREQGELQWTKYGLSGIVVFQLSRFVALSRDRFCFLLNLLPGITETDIALLLRRIKQIPEEKVSGLLAGFLPDKLIPVVLERAGFSAGITCQKLSEKDLLHILHTARNFRTDIAGTKSFDTCQVCAGGIDCSEVSPKTLESKLHKGLYFAGEILDVDGPCGGYNLQWAWSSGAAAGYWSSVNR